ncbi:MAG: hypothetical protein K2K38_03370 [Clostridia bacterium]|nr:hypothetical protein [Clostridia bacterium]
MKIRALCCCIFASFTVFLCGCVGCGKTISYPFHYDESEIESISIVYTLEDYYATQSDYETLAEIEDIDDFLIKFKEIKFGKYFIGDPIYVSGNCNVILVKYYNGDCEFIHWVAQDIIVNDALYDGRVYCDEEEFNNFINSYLTDNP